jgi:hypothetical protein
MAPARWQHVVLDPAHQDRVRRLLADEPLATPALGHQLSLHDLRGGKRRGPETAHLAGVDQVAQRAERLIDIGVGLRAMDLVEVDPVGVEPSQTVLDLLDEPAARVGELVRVIAHRSVDLGRENHVLAAAAAQRLRDDLLRFAARVDVRRVGRVSFRTPCSGRLQWRSRALDEAPVLLSVAAQLVDAVFAAPQHSHSGIT